ncbi:hypothetical protein IFM89_007283 [Coptis chinensis]|uniref:BED-type domain-containing protein n=1 Tax=Coptis chinensis TaxID=261450 RepID=A0A835IIE3_9MAGN|nr:hypothetical protein IFM89_007283 [Coptis chinensis]
MEGIPLMGSDPDNDVDMVVGNPPVVTPKIPRKTSHVWKQFDKVTEKNDDGTIMKQPNGKDVMKAVCKICSEKLVFGGRSGTSHLSRHATSCLKRTTSDVGQTIIGRIPTGGIYSFTFNQARARRETVRELFHLRCNAHITNLLVKDGLKHVESSLENIRESVRHVKYSPSKLQKFFETCQSLNMKVKRLPMDIQTRWNSTYLMLEAAIPYQKVFDLLFYDSDFAYKPDLVDWQNAIVIKDFFEIFYVSTKSFSCSNSVTSSTFCFQLSKIVLILKRVENVPSFKPLYDSIKWKYDKYWKDVPMLLGLASCMDSRFKFTVLELCLDFNYDYNSQSQPESQSPSISSENPWLLPYKTKLN